VPVTIVATVGSATANSFVTLAECLTYLEGRLNAGAFEDAEAEDDQNRALVEATREISLLQYEGARTDNVQALAWPRTYAPDPDASYVAGLTWPAYFDDDEIPQRVRDATCELALEFLRAGTADIANPDRNTVEGLVAKKIGPLAWEWDRRAAGKEGLSRFSRVYSLLNPLARIGTRDVVRS
jgi:hypothetical protein